ncbi:MAG: hypothetical protein JSR82_04770 [Verrucomicrobia bacterium]|nr:hypothetical protein [Verrucomicrobiota bacterium]
MPRLISRAVLPATTAALLLALGGCESTDSGASGTFRVQNISSSGTGANSGGESSVRIRLSTSGNVAEADLSSIVAYVKIVAKREATKRQAMIAAQRARAASARMSPEQRKSSRYIAVDTERSAAYFDTQPAQYVEGANPTSSGPAPKFERSVMLWDTQTQSLVGNAVYDIASTPKVGQKAAFDTVVATYVGTGGS